MYRLLNCTLRRFDMYIYSGNRDRKSRADTRTDCSVLGLLDRECGRNLRNVLLSIVIIDCTTIYYYFTRYLKAFKRGNVFDEHTENGVAHVAGLTIAFALTVETVESRQTRRLALIPHVSRLTQTISWKNLSC